MFYLDLEYFLDPLFILSFLSLLNIRSILRVLILIFLFLLYHVLHLYSHSYLLFLNIHNHLLFFSFLLIFLNFLEGLLVGGYFHHQYVHIHSLLRLHFWIFFLFLLLFLQINFDLNLSHILNIFHSKHLLSHIPLLIPKFLKFNFHSLQKQSLNNSHLFSQKNFQFFTLNILYHFQWVITINNDFYFLFIF